MKNKDEKVTLTMTIKQAETLAMATELVSRLYMGQTDMLDRVCDANWDSLRLVKRIMFPDLADNAYNGILSEKLPDEPRQLWDIHQVLRHHLSWRKEKNTPETRDWPRQMTVNFDDPMKTSDQPLPVIKEMREK